MKHSAIENWSVGSTAWQRWLLSRRVGSTAWQRLRRLSWFAIWLLFALACLADCSHCEAQEANLNAIAADLQVPPVAEGEPAAGCRVWHHHPDYAKWELAHALYLPTDWQPGKKYPVIFEYPGNGGYKNQLGDTCDGTPAGCKLGYGLTGGVGAIWVCLPILDSAKHHATNWWPDPDATTDYCQSVVELICKEFGGDSGRLILCGFSRGAIGTSYLGLRNDSLAGRWRAIFAHSHFDGVRAWPYSDSDAQSARQRLGRFHGSLWVSHEMSVADTEKFLRDSMLDQVEVTAVSIPYPNHSDQWVLKDIPERQRARQWLRDVLK